jgi:uncharacterized protein YjiS (DUF1127 family)
MRYAFAQMTVLEALVPGLAPTRSGPSRLALALKAARARRKTIRDYEALMRIDSHLLDDIGISRTEVQRALSQAQQG